MYDTLVIGAGQAGLASGYYLKRAGLSFALLEAAATPTGSWPQYYDSLQLFSPARFSSLPGSPFPGDPDRYPHREEVSAYLQSYARHFHLPIFFQQEVCRVERRQSHFEVVTATGTSYQARTLIAATGPFRQPHIPVFPGQEHFQGQILHATSYRSPEPFRDQRVLVIGAGNSAVQIAVELAQVAQVTLTSRQPVRFLPQRPWGRDVHFWMWLLGIDRLAWPSLWQRRKSNPVLDAGRYQAAIASSRPEWRPLFESLTPQGVVWTNGQTEEVHTLLLATCYQFQPSYLSALPALDEYGQVFHRRGGSLRVPVQTADETYTARAVIIATGASAKWLGLPNEQRLLGHGVSVCATCDGFFFRSKEVVVVGGGDTAMEEALFLTHFARQVTIIHRRETFRASPVLVEQAQSHPKIRFILLSEVVDILGENTVTAVSLRQTKTNEKRTLPIQGVFLAVGHHPNTELFQGALPRDQEGYLLPVERTLTALAGVFIAGDVADPSYRQVITAAAGWQSRSDRCSTLVRTPASPVPPDHPASLLSSCLLLITTLRLTTIEKEAILAPIPLLLATTLTEREEINGTTANDGRLVTRGRPLTYAASAQLRGLLWRNDDYPMHGSDRTGAQWTSDFSRVESAHRL